MLVSLLPQRIFPHRVQIRFWHTALVSSSRLLYPSDSNKPPPNRKKPICCLHVYSAPPSILALSSLLALSLSSFELKQTDTPKALISLPSSSFTGLCLLLLPSLPLSKKRVNWPLIPAVLPPTRLKVGTHCVRNRDTFLKRSGGCLDRSLERDEVMYVWPLWPLRRPVTLSDVGLYRCGGRKCVTTNDIAGWEKVCIRVRLFRSDDTGQSDSYLEFFLGERPDS